MLIVRAAEGESICTGDVCKLWRDSELRLARSGKDKKLFAARGNLYMFRESFDGILLCTCMCLDATLALDPHLFRDCTVPTSNADQALQILSHPPLLHISEMPLFAS